MSEISEFLIRRYGPAGGRGRPTIEQIERYWTAFRPYADRNFVQEFCTDNPEAYQQRYWELFLGAAMIGQGLRLRPNNGQGPDISFSMGERTVWVEAISPGPGTGNNRVPEMVFHEEGTALPADGQDVPARQTLLRYTAAIEEKVRKYRDYRRDEIVLPTDPFVIALDTSQLGIFGFHGISTFPAVLEAVYPVGAMQVHFPLGGNNRAVKTDLQHRPSVLNANAAEIVTTRFLDVAYEGVSGILCSSRDDGTLTPPIPIIFVHNKLAANPIYPSPIQVDEEYRLEDVPNGYQILVTRPDQA